MSSIVSKTADPTVLTSEVLQFISELHSKFERRRADLLEQRAIRQAQFDNGELPCFKEETRHIREDPTWRCAPLAPGLRDRRVEITGPTDRKMVINALNSDVSTYMADFEG